MNFNLSLQADATTTPMLNAEARLEAIAVDIEMTQSVAVFRIGQRLAEARDLFKYDRTVGGFEGWVKSRCPMRNTATDCVISISTAIASSLASALSIGVVVASACKERLKFIADGLHLLLPPQR
jgi:hypothetical protein